MLESLLLVAPAGGLTATAPGDTVIDVAARCGIDAGATIVDAVLRHGLASRLELEALSAEYSDAGRPRHRLVAETVAFADPRAESPLESISRARLRLLGIAPDDIQHPVTTRSGRRVRVDFFWEDRRVIGECDGRIKYGRALSGVPAEETV